MLYSCSAQISIVSVDPVNSTAVTVTWISTSLNGSVVDHSTVHYSSLTGSGIGSSGTVTFPASASSGVVSGLQEGQQYQFSVSVSLLIDGQLYTNTPVEPFTAKTGKHDLPWRIAEYLMTVYLSTEHLTNNVCTTTDQNHLLTSCIVFTTVLPSSFPPSLTSSCLSYSAGLGVVSVIMITSLIGNLVLLVIVCLLRRRKHLLGSIK